MRVLQVISHYVPAVAFGGPLQVAHGLGRALVREGHSVTVCCTNLRDPDAPLDVPVGTPIDRDGVRVFYERVPVGRYWGYSPDLARRVWNESASADLVVTHFHYQFASAVGGWVARQRHVPHVVFTHGSLNRHGVGARRAGVKRAYLRLLEASNFRRALFSAYQSETEREQSISFGGPTLLVPLGVELPGFDDVARGSFRRARPETGSRLLLLFIGRLAPGKGLDLLLSAFQRLVRDGVDAHLVVVGGDERGYFRFLLDQHPDAALRERLTCTGMLTGTAKLEVLRDADVFVLPSRSEGTSLVTLEAMAAGLPVIISDRVGIWPEVRAAGAGEIVSYDASALEQAMRLMVNRPDRCEMGERGRAYVARAHDWSTIASTFVRDVQDALARRRSP